MSVELRMELSACRVLRAVLIQSVDVVVGVIVVVISLTISLIQLSIFPDLVKFLYFEIASTPYILPNLVDCRNYRLRRISFFRVLHMNMR